jgi:hypothetical protein
LTLALRGTAQTALDEFSFVQERISLWFSPLLPEGLASQISSPKISTSKDPVKLFFAARNPQKKFTT